MRDHVEFFRQFRSRFKTTGAVAPSSRFLATAMTGPLERCNRPVRILEIGPGTGAVTRRIVAVMKPEDRLDLVELNETFVALLERRFVEDPVYRAAAARSKIHNCPLQDFSAGAGYDFVISGLPLNNFEADLVREIFEAYFRLLAPQGVLSYFEYMYVRTMRRYVSAAAERGRLRELDDIMQPYLSRHRFQQNWVFANLPPAWVQHLKKPDGS